MKKSQIILAIVALILVGVFLGKTEKKEPAPLVTNFEECAKAGNPIMESYPRQCIHEGKNFVEIVEEDREIEEVVLPPHSPTEEEDEPIACTMDAKICPDGSAVGRTGPNCEFAPCP